VLSRPQSYRIDVPYHRQQTDFGCGDASLQMILDYYGVQVNQFSVMDVMRSTTHEGTLSLEIIRGAHFSALSSSMGRLYPDFKLRNGYPNQPIGLAAFWKDNYNWLNEVKDLIAQNVPVMVLVDFAVNGTHDGHFRVVVGYDDQAGTITTNDPWDRDGTPRYYTFSEADFLSTWKYRENDSPRPNPYFGVAIYPWQVNAKANIVSQTTSNTTVQISVVATYPCLGSFDCSAYQASNAIVELQFESDSYDYDTSPLQMTSGSSQSVYVGSFPTNTPYSTTFQVTCAGVCTGQLVSVTARGIVNGNIPSEFGDYYQSPAYNYIDVIGGSVELTLP
jgi:hypothetical protein